MKETKTILKYRKVKQSTIIGIAILIAFLINLPRILELYDIVDSLGKSFSSTTIKDILMRTGYLLIFSWIGLQFNTNWKFLYVNLNKHIRTLVTISINTFLFFVTVFSFFSLYSIVTGESLNESDKGLLYFVYFIVLLILIFIARILRYQIIHQDDIAEKELLKQQSLQNELTALKNQINPHFLFNSLNSLNSLVRENEQATTFVNKLSFMYRYILQSGQVDVTLLKDELKFLESYLYLIKTRYREKFKTIITIEDYYLNEEIPVMALQLLVENAVKHNEISSDNPLEVNIYSENGYIIVENKIKIRNSFVDSTGNGLVNLNKRYLLLKKKNIIINNENQVFKVKLPLN